MPSDPKQLILLIADRMPRLNLKLRYFAGGDVLETEQSVVRLELGIPCRAVFLGRGGQQLGVGHEVEAIGLRLGQVREVVVGEPNGIRRQTLDLLDWHAGFDIVVPKESCFIWA